MTLTRICPNCYYYIKIEPEDIIVKCPKCGVNLKLLGRLLKKPVMRE